MSTQRCKRRIDAQEVSFNIKNVQHTGTRNHIKTKTNSKASIDEERAELINGVKSLFSDRGMTIINWIAIARQIEDILEAEGEKQGKDLLPNGKRYFPKDISERRLENSVCAGWKKLEA